jgi:glutamine amidotransferase
MARVAVIDYGMGNLGSIRRACEECGATVRIVRDPADAGWASHLILPGVGAFPDGAANLRATGWDARLAAARDAGTPLLGICLGMQLLFERGSEVRDCAGLGLLPGDVPRLSPVGDERLPHVGWNGVRALKDHPLFAGIPASADFYFVHSYRVRPSEPGDVIAMGDYAGGFPAVVGRGALVGVQFHPEKSQRHGLHLLGNFLAARPC